MTTKFPISDNELKTIEDKATKVCKELHKIFPYCMINYRLRDDLLYQFNIDFMYLNNRICTNVYIDHKVMLAGLPDLLAKFMYERYILMRMVRVKIDTKNEEVNNGYSKDRLI